MYGEVMKGTALLHQTSKGQEERDRGNRHIWSGVLASTGFDCDL